MKKIFSLLAVTLMAVHVMATVESVDFSQQGYQNAQIIEYYGGENFGVLFDVNTSGMTINHAAYYNSGSAVRVYPGGNFEVHVTDSFKISSIIIGFGNYDNDNEITPTIGTLNGNTWTGSAQKVKFSIGKKSDGTNGGHRRIQSLKVTYHRDTTEGSAGIDPSTNIEAFLGIGISTLGSFVRNPEVYGEWMLIYPRKFAANEEIHVFISNTEDVFGCSTTLTGCIDLAHFPAVNEYCYIEQAGWHNIYFRPNRDGGDDWCRGCIKMDHLAQGPDPTNCYEASLFVGQEDANVLYNNGKTYTLEGYVMEIKEAYQDKYHNISFWISDNADDTWRYVEAFRAQCPKASHAVVVGDKVRVTGKLMKYSKNNSSNTIIEFTEGCTYEILNREEVDPDPNSEGIDNQLVNENCQNAKLLKDGQLLILRGDKTYTVTGQEVIVP